MEKVTTKQAAKELNIGVDTLQYLMTQEKLPIGFVIKRDGSKRTTYIIYRGLLDQFKLRIENDPELSRKAFVL